jgi:ATP-dependent Clp protease protease subunit
MTEPWNPHIPYPFPPLREPPERRGPLMVPIVYEPTGRDPVRRLYERRRVLLGGPLDAAAATAVAAELMSLDGHSGRDIELLVNSPGGPVDDVFAVLDVITLSRAPVSVTCFGRAIGTAAIVLACGTGTRRATPNATISLRCREQTSIVGSAREAEQRAEHERQVRGRIRRIVGERTRLPADRIDHELDDGAQLDASGALELGIIDEVVTRPSP